MERKNSERNRESSDGERWSQLPQNAKDLKEKIDWQEEGETSERPSPARDVGNTSKIDVEKEEEGKARRNGRSWCRADVSNVHGERGKDGNLVPLHVVSSVPASGVMDCGFVNREDGNIVVHTKTPNQPISVNS